MRSGDFSRKESSSNLQLRGPESKDKWEESTAGVCGKPGGFYRPVRPNHQVGVVVLLFAKTATPEPPRDSPWSPFLRRAWPSRNTRLTLATPAHTVSSCGLQG